MELKSIQYKNLIRKNEILFKSIEIAKDNFSGNSPPSVFVGSKLEYPRVNVGILSPPQKVEDSWIYDSPKTWINQNLSITDIIKLRSSLINSRFQSTVYNMSARFLDISQEVAMAIKPVEVEIELKKKIKFSFDFDKVDTPMGPRAPLKRVRITSNPRIPAHIDKVVSDTDLKSTEALNYLYKHEYDEHTLTKILSIGLLGLKENRKLVPTKWAITAVDDAIGKQIINEIRNYSTINNCLLFQGDYLGNFYYILLLPGPFRFELFETYLPDSSWNNLSGVSLATDYEDVTGRKGYAENTAGGYYAARLAVLEKLKEMKKQASVLVLRIETPSYWASLGVWVVREAARKTFSSMPICSEGWNIILQNKELIKQRFLLDLDKILQRSIILNGIKQKRLDEFLNHKVIDKK